MQCYNVENANRPLHTVAINALEEKWWNWCMAFMLSTIYDHLNYYLKCIFVISFWYKKRSKRTVAKGNVRPFGVYNVLKLYFSFWWTMQKCSLSQSLSFSDMKKVCKRIRNIPFPKTLAVKLICVSALLTYLRYQPNFSNHCYLKANIPLQDTSRLYLREACEN